MPTIKFIQDDGSEQDVDAAIGESVMKAAMNHMVPNVLAECGGACACATCHGYIEAPWSERISPPDEMEQAMLELALDVKPSSRLTCQIQLSADLDGLVVHLPASQN